MDVTDTVRHAWSRAFVDWTNGRSLSPRRDDRIRLLCFPPAGSGASMFRFWAMQLAPVADVWPIQLPGREGRWNEAPPTNLTALAEALGDVLVPLFEQPFALIGHSMGAFIAFELARALRRRRTELPVSLFACGARAPHLPDPDPLTFEMSDERFLLKVGSLRGVPAELLDHPEMMRVMLPTIRADLAVSGAYVCREERPLDCPIAVLGGSDDRDVPVTHLNAWSRHTTRRFSVQMFPGHHFFLFDRQSTALRAVMAELLGTMNRAAV